MSDHTETVIQALRDAVQRLRDAAADPVKGNELILYWPTNGLAVAFDKPGHCQPISVDRATGFRGGDTVPRVHNANGETAAIWRRADAATHHADSLESTIRNIELSA